MTRKSSVSTVTCERFRYDPGRIVSESSYALSIVLVSIGDGPCADMRKFNDMIPKFEFNNFQIMMRDSSELAKRTAFALAALNFRFCAAHVAMSFTEQT
ncbi:hypothetical protein Bca4012_063557 [Brassica carinata]